jgi:hypothetical protein
MASGCVPQTALEERSTGLNKTTSSLMRTTSYAPLSDYGAPRRLPLSRHARLSLAESLCRTSAGTVKNTAVSKPSSTADVSFLEAVFYKAKPQDCIFDFESLLLMCSNLRKQRVL